MTTTDIKAVLFDLDGTLLDTIEDLTDSLNYVLAQYSLPLHTAEEVKRYVGNGIPRLLERAVSKHTSNEQIDQMYRKFLAYYQAHCRIKTRPYQGIPELLAELRKKGFRLAVISNKVDTATRELILYLFGHCFDFVLGATEGRKLKPDRAMLDAAMRGLSVDPSEAIYVGDSQVDIESARNAGIPCISVTWGFRSRDSLIEGGASMLADTPDDVLRFILSVDEGKESLAE